MDIYQPACSPASNICRAPCDMYQKYHFSYRHTPFALSDTDSPKTILERIGKGEFEMSGRLWDSISGPAKELVKLMLDVDPR